MSSYSLGVASVDIPYTFTRNKITYYQRAIPRDLLSKYKGKTIKIPLASNDPLRIAREVQQLNAEYEAEWARLRCNPESSPASLKSHAKAYLRGWALSPGDIPPSSPGEVTTYDLLQDHLDEKKVRHAEAAYPGVNDPEVFDSIPAADYLDPVELEALKLMHQSHKATYGVDAVRLYIEDSGKSKVEKFVADTQRAVSGFLAVTGGDRPVEEITRDDAKLYIKKETERGCSTGTVRRRMNALRAVYEHWITEKQLDRRNPFASLKIEGEGQDRKKRETLTDTSREKLSAECKIQDDDMRWLLALLVDSGMRIAEGAGLLLSDLVLDDPIPHIKVQSHGWRSLKTDRSSKSATRDIPLVGLSLWAAQRVVASAGNGQRMAFPRYCDGVVTKATHASNALNDWMESRGLLHTCHELRHTLTDRLRDVQAPSDVIDRVLGWMPAAMRARYGKGNSLAVCQEWLLKVVEGEA